MSGDKLKITRRGFVKGAGVLTGAAALLGDSMEASGAGQARKLRPSAAQIDLTVNGEPHPLALEPGTTRASPWRDEPVVTRAKSGGPGPWGGERRRPAARAPGAGGSAPAGPPRNGEDRAVAVGVLGASVRQAERKIPASEPKPWDAETKLAVVGRPTPRIEGPEKVTGRARYCYDVRLPGMLHAAMVRSPHAHTRIRNVDVSAAEKMPGVKATYVVERVLGPAELRIKAKAPGKYPIVRYEGQPVAAVAASTRALAEDAARRVKVDYEVLPHASDIEAAQRPDAPLVFEGPVEQPSTAGGGGAPKGLPQRGNVRGPNVQTIPKEGNVDEALSAKIGRASCRERV